MVNVTDSEFRREMREDSLTREKSLFLPELVGDVTTETSIDGNIFKEVSNGRATVRITTPKTPLLLLGQRPEIEGYGTNERRAAFGADEGYLVDRFSLEGLELLIEVMVSRSLELFGRAENHDSINQLYPYGTFDTHNKRLTGRLLVLKETMPRIEREITELSTYIAYHSRCKVCDIQKEEQARKNEGQTRFIYEYGDMIAFAPFGSSDTHNVRIVSYTHTPRMTDCKSDQLRDLAKVVYTIMEAFPHIVPPRDRFYHTVDFAIHSSPLSAQDIHFPEEVTKKILNSSNGKTRDVTDPTKFLEQLYHFHVEMGIGNIPLNGSPLTVPFSDMHVNAGRPVAFAEKFRNHLNYHP